MSKNEGLLLLHGYLDQQERLRTYGELLGKFNTYTLFRDETISLEKTKQFRLDILEAQKNLYASLNQAIV